MAITHFIDSIYRTFRPYQDNVYIIFALIIFIALGFYAYRIFARRTVEMSDLDNVSNAQRDGANGEAQIMLFTVDWCPHCKNAVKPWEQFTKKYDHELVNETTLRCITTNCTNEDDPEVIKLIKQFNINSYPAVKLIRTDKSVVDYDAKITADNLETFVHAMV